MLSTEYCLYALEISACNKKCNVTMSAVMCDVSYLYSGILGSTIGVLSVMKKHNALISVVSIWAVLLVGAALPVAAHTPVPGPNFAGCTSGGNTLMPFAPVPKFNINVLGSPVNFDDARGNYNFCAYADNIYCSLEFVASLADEVAEFADLVQCRYADINGPLNLEADIPVSPNGMPDGQYELGLLAYILNTPSHALHGEATIAFEDNFKAIKDLVVEALYVTTLKIDDKDIRSLVQMLAPYLVGSLSAVLGGFATLGDETTNTALDELIGLLGEIGLEPPEGGIGAITDGVPAIGPQGDLDDDGYTNIQEYMYFVGTLGYTPEAFIAAALDPNQKPPTIEPEIRLSMKTGNIKIGDNVTIKLTMRNFIDPPSQISWYKDGVLLVGEEDTTLTIESVQASDEGLYRVEVETTQIIPDKGNTLSEAVPVTLTAYLLVLLRDASVPVGGLAALGALAAVCALAGAMRLRRRN